MYTRAPVTHTEWASALGGGVPRCPGPKCSKQIIVLSRAFDLAGAAATLTILFQRFDGTKWPLECI